MRDLGVVLCGVLVDGEEAFFGVEGEVAGAVIGEVVSAVAITDDEKLNEAQKRAGVAVTGVVLVLYDLLHCPAGIDAEGLEFDLHGGHAVDQEENVVAVVAVVGVGAELARDLEAVLAPVLDVDQRVVERGAVVAGEAVYAAEYFCGTEGVGRDDLVEKTLELAVGQLDAVECLELFAEVALKRGAVSDAGAAAGIPCRDPGLQLM